MLVAMSKVVHYFASVETSLVPKPRPLANISLIESPRNGGAYGY
jgi:hypothetical protein